uniref:Uncharacterized protein n=1 Tax=Arundo donax TaxID=35708 RepID=A0A0A9B563_ARUDO
MTLHVLTDGNSLNLCTCPYGTIVRCLRSVLMSSIARSSTARTVRTG